MSKSSIAAVALVLVMVASGFAVATMNVAADQGSRDSYGYTWRDSNSPAPSVAFNWVEINTTGTDTGLTGSLMYVGPMPVGFDFNFYGNTYNTFYATTSGFVSFGSGSSSSSNYQIPDWWSPDDIIAPYWDYNSNDYGHVYYQTIGIAPDRQLVVEWEDVSAYNGDLVTFEVILNETGDIWFQYLEVGADYGQSASVGIENSYGDIGSQYSYNSAVLSNNLAIRFSTGPLMISPSQTAYGLMGSTVSYTLTVKNWQGFSDSFGITYYNDLGWTVALYDSLLNPLTDTDGDTIPDTGSVASGSTVDIVVTVDIPASPSGYTALTQVNATSYANSANVDFCTLTTIVSGAWFTPPHEDAGLDPTGEGDFDVLSVNVSLNVRVEGWYYIYAYLHLPSELSISFDSVSGYLYVGANTLNLRFLGWNIREQNTDGPYHVHLTLYDTWWEIQDEGIHTTQAYAYSDFMLRPGYLDTDHADGVEDTDADGLYDLLYINATVIANYDWRFMVEVDLYDSSPSYMFYDQVDVNLVAGSNVVPISFNAWDIVEQGQNGTFRGDIYLYAWVDGGWYYMGYDSHTTPSYLLSEFEKRPLVFTGTFSDSAEDTDGDSYYNYLQITAEVDVGVEGDYTITGVLRADSWQPIIDTVSNTTHLTPGINYVNLTFPGWPIRENSDSDDMDISFEAWGNGTLLDTATYTTWTYYYYYDFEMAPGWFEPPYSEHGVDADSDLLYDWLVAQIPVTVDEAGYYEIEATLEAIWDVQTVTNTTYLSVGTTTVEIWFTGWMIYDNGWDGPFYIYMYLYDSGSRQMDYDSFYTAAYAYTDFETLPAWFGSPHEAYVADLDSDGDFDGLFVNVTVEVDSAGTYIVQGYLYDSGWNWVADAGARVTLDTGTQVVQFSFPAWMINGRGYNGTYNVELYLYDYARNYLDYDWVGTASYTYDTFDSTVPRITCAWASAAPAADGVISAGEWAGATTVSLEAASTANGVYGTLMVMNDATNLYIAYDAWGDTHQDNGDYSTVAFETSNDGLFSDGDEDVFRVSATGEEHYTYNTAGASWNWHCSFDTVQLDHSTLAGGASFGASPSHPTSHRVYEYSIPLALLEAAPGDVLGFLGMSWNYYGLYDSFNWTDSSWPVAFEDSPEVNQYGELSLASAPPLIPPPVTTATIAGTAGSSGWYVSGVNVTLSATGGDGGVDYTEYSLNSGAWTNYTVPIAISADGTHSLRFRSADMASQVETIKTATIKIDRTVPATSADTSGSWVWLNATDGCSGVGTVMYRIDGGAWTACTGAFNVTGTKGMHTVEYYATDAAGNAEATHTIQVEVSEGTGGGVSGLLSNPFLWIALIAAVAVVLVVVLLVMKRRRGQQPATYPGPGQPMPAQPQPMPEYPPPPAPPGMG